MRGGEKVIEALLEMFPDADIYTHVYNPAVISKTINSHHVYTSYINHLPFAKKLYQLYMPLMPNALLGFNLQKYDLVISSESGPAKGVVPNPDAYHLCYCHTPMRYLWDMYHDYLNESSLITRFFMKHIIPSLRQWDICSSNLVDCFIANSNYVAKRILRAYNRTPEVVFPPVDIEKFIKYERKPADYYLFLGQLTSYKRADIAIDACIKSRRKIVVAGAGMNRNKKRKYEKSGLVSFLEKITDEKKAILFSEAKALLFPGIEDFGIVPIEANAGGCPVIAFRKGGALDTIQENVTGLFFDEQTPESLITTIEYYENHMDIFTDRKKFTGHVQKFSKAVFKENIQRLIEERQRI